MKTQALIKIVLFVLLAMRVSLCAQTGSPREWEAVRARGRG